MGVTEPKRPIGRPPLNQSGSTRTSVMLSTPDYDRLCQRALRDGVSLSEVIRRQLQDDDRDD